jgi:hypothetical protein
MVPVRKKDSINIDIILMTSIYASYMPKLTLTGSKTVKIYIDIKCLLPGLM